MLKIFAETCSIMSIIFYFAANHMTSPVVIICYVDYVMTCRFYLIFGMLRKLGYGDREMVIFIVAATVM